MTQPGHYATKQIFSRSRLVAWSHGSRFALGRALVAPYAGGRLLDYGCGDGTFLGMVRDLFPESLGVDVTPDQIDDCRRRFADDRGVAFALTDGLQSKDHDARYDVVVCMEVLEHCPDDVQERVIGELHRVAAPGGTIVISVPLEIGPSLAAKQAARALAGLRGLSEYDARERYTAAEMMRALFAGPDSALAREETTAMLGDGRTIRFTGHKGFNWRRLERRIAARLRIRHRSFSPIPLTQGLLNSQAWFVCSKA